MSSASCADATDVEDSVDVALPDDSINMDDSVALPDESVAYIPDDSELVDMDGDMFQVDESG